MGKIATPQEVTIGKELRGGCWMVLMHIHGGGTLSFPPDIAHQLARDLVGQANAIDKIVRGNGKGWPRVHRPR